MAFAGTRTLMPLDRFFDIIHASPLLANQIVSTQDAADPGGCGQPWLQNAFQFADRLGREELAAYLSEAETTLARYLRFKVAPTWEVADEVEIRSSHESTIDRVRSFGEAGRLGYVLRTSWGYVERGGIEKKTLIDSSVPITYTDEDEDGFDELATVTFATSVADPSEIMLVYPGADPEGTREIRPLYSIAISGGDCTIQFRRTQCVKQNLVNRLVGRALSIAAEEADNFITEVDVYRRTTDPSVQVEFMWYRNGCDYTGGITTQAGQLNVLDPRLGIVEAVPATWNADTLVWDPATCILPGVRPHRVRLWYKAGWRFSDSPGAVLRPNGYRQLDPLWEMAVTRLAFASFDRPLCGCEGLQAEVDMWREDLALRLTNGQRTSSYNVAERHIGNPIGTRRGHVYAWDSILRHALPE